MPPYLIQPNRYSCGVLSVLNAISSLGGESTYDEVYSSVGTTSRAGTSDDGILSGLSELGYKGREYIGQSPDAAWRYVRRNCKDHPIIILSDEWRHWIVIVGMSGRNVIAIDSSPNVRKNEAGALVMSGGSPVWTEDFGKAKFYGSVNDADDDYETLKELGFSVGVGG